MAGQAVNLSGQINQIANSLMQPATLSQGQKGLLGELRRGLAPTPQYDTTTPQGLQVAIQESLRRGDTAAAEQYTKVLKQMMEAQEKQADRESREGIAAQKNVTENRAIDERTIRQEYQHRHEERMAQVEHLRDVALHEMTGEQKAMLQNLKSTAAMDRLQVKHDLDMLKVDKTNENAVKAANVKFARDLDKMAQQFDNQWKQMVAKEAMYTDREKVAHLNNMAEIRAKGEETRKNISLRDENTKTKVDQKDLELTAALIKYSENPAIKQFLAIDNRFLAPIRLGKDDNQLKKLATAALRYKNQNGGTYEAAIAAIAKQLGGVE